MRTTVSVFLSVLFVSGCNLSKKAALRSSRVDRSTLPAGLPSPTRTEGCDVIVIGGSTAGVAAAIAAAREFEAERGPRILRRPVARVACLVEPTDWPGGQLTASGVSAVDFAHHKVPVAGLSIPGFSPTADQQNKQLNLSKLTRLSANNARVFVDWMNAVAPNLSGTFEMANNPGKCWVSVRCYDPNMLVAKIRETLTQLEQSGSLKVFYNAVPKAVDRDGRVIRSVYVVQRTPKQSNQWTWENRLSKTIGDWYSTQPSATFEKTNLLLTSKNSTNQKPIVPYVIDGTEWGELLVLSGASYLQGAEASENNPQQTNETCGQAIVYPVTLSLAEQDVGLPAWWNQVMGALPHPEHYSIPEGSKAFTFDDVWAYRRLRLASPAAAGRTWGVPTAALGEVSSQNWTTGNDYPYRYLFPPKAMAAAQVSDWRGGVDVQTLAEAEAHALGWVSHLREKAPNGWGTKIGLSNYNGTESGLSKVPYIRDTRRSVGNGGFVLKYADIQAGKTYPDAVAIGSYAADVHATKNSGCAMPAHVRGMNPASKPFFLPFAAHTNRDLDNFLVAGKLIAQTFAASTATRLHPIEFNSGTAAGVAAAYLQRLQLVTADVSASSQHAQDIRKRITAIHGPVDWQNVSAAVE